MLKKNTKKTVSLGTTQLTFIPELYFLLFLECKVHEIPPFTVDLKLQKSNFIYSLAKIYIYIIPEGKIYQANEQYK